jgi:hypothetical protein
MTTMSMDTTNSFYRTYIFIFDSLGGQHDEAIGHLSSYLQMEAKQKKGLEIPGIAGISARVQCF